jgi:bisphosphoglycerate-dependent phosphoglycerate mutase
MPAPAALVLLLHGQSVLNARNRFTGLLDPALTRAGADGAARAGALPSSTSLSPDTVYTAIPTRSRDTARIVLDVLGGPDVPVLAAWELNERSYGSSTGRARRELPSEPGPEVFRFSRRSCYGAPPPMNRTEPGETDDTFVADPAVQSGCGQLKPGAPARGERVPKYNRLLGTTDEDPALPYGPTGTHLNDADPNRSAHE